MELPQELEDLIKEFAKPLTRPDWKYNFPIHRQAVYAENPLFGEELPDDAYGHEIYYDDRIKNPTDYDATDSAKALQLFFEIKQGARIFCGFPGFEYVKNPTGDDKFYENLLRKIIKSALNSNPPFLN